MRFFRNLLEHQYVRYFLKFLTILLIGAFVAQVVRNLRGGYILVPPLELNDSTVLREFQSSLYPISILYPEEWNARDTVNGYHNDKDAIFVINTMFHDYPFVEGFRKEMEAATLNDVADWGEQLTRARLFSQKTYKEIELRKIKLNGRTVLLRVLNYNILTSIKCKQVYLLDGSHAYIVDLCVDETNDTPQIQDVFNKMIESIQVGNPSK